MLAKEVKKFINEMAIELKLENLIKNLKVLTTFVDYVYFL